MQKLTLGVRSNLQFRRLNLPRKPFSLSLGLTSTSVKSNDHQTPTAISVFVAPDVVSYLQMPNNARKTRLLVSKKHSTHLTEIRNMIESKLVALTGQPYKLRYRLSSQPDAEPKPINSDDDIRSVVELSAQASSNVQLFIHANPGVFPPAGAEGNTNSKLHPAVTEMRASHIDPSDSEFYTMVSFYSFSNIEDPDILAQDLERLWQPFQALGRVYVAKEGINAQMAVPDNALKYFEAATRGLPQLSSMRLNCDSTVPRVEFSVTKPFRALHVRVRDQVLTDGFGASELDWKLAGSEMHPLEWHQRLSSMKEGEENAVVIDCRNSYESDVGIFEGAVPLNTTFFRESWPVLEELLRDTPKDTPVLTYCTGGIRCVKVNAFLQQRLGFTNTHRLQGGIIAYNRELETLKAHSATSSRFRGVNYVFDERVEERVTDDVLTVCEQCALPCDSFTNCQHYLCNVRFLQCAGCGIQYGGCCSKACQTAFSTIAAKERQHVRGILSRKARRTVAAEANSQEEAIIHAASSPAVLMEGSGHSGEAGLMEVLAQYCEEHSTQEPAMLAALREETLCLYKNSPGAARMLCDPLQGRVLAMLSTLTRARYVLELGAFTGYSAISLALGLGGDAEALHRRVITCEPDAICRGVAEKHIQQAGLVDHIDLRSTKAMEVIESLRCGPTPQLLDLVFIDADKKRYRDYVQALLGDDLNFEGKHNKHRPLLRNGALIVADNTLWKGLVLPQQVGSSLKSSTSPRLVAIADSMRSFNDFVASEPRLQTVMLPLRDGLTVMRYSSSK